MKLDQNAHAVAVRRLTMLLPVAVALCALLPSRSAAADVVLEMAKTGNEPTSQKMYLAPQGLRMEVDDAGKKQTIIFNKAKQTVWLVDTAAGTYHEITKSDLDKARGQLDQARAQMEAQLKNLPPDQRAAVEDMMKKRMPAAAAGPKAPETTYERGPKGKKVGKWSCDVWKAKRNGTPASELCVARPGAVGVTPSDFAVFRDFAKMFEGFGADRQMADVWASAGSKDPNRPQGFPVQYVRLGPDGKPKETTELRKVDKARVDPSKFQLPSGLKKVGEAPPAH